MADARADVFIKLNDLTTLRQTFKVIGSFINETKIEFNKNCMSITDVDTTGSFMVDFKLKAKNIEACGGKYKLVRPCSVGINVNQFEKELNALLPDGEIVITAEHGKYLRFVNYMPPPNKLIQQFILQTMDLDQSKFDEFNMEKPSVAKYEGGAKTKISSSILFSQLAAKNKSLGDVSIRLVLNQDGFQICGVSLNDIASSAVNFGGDYVGPTISNVYALKHLQKMAAAEKVNREMEIYLKQKFPVMFVYKPKTLGTLKLVLSPRVEENEIDDFAAANTRKRKRADNDDDDNDDDNDDDDNDDNNDNKAAYNREEMLTHWTTTTTNSDDNDDSS